MLPINNFPTFCIHLPNGKWWTLYAFFAISDTPRLLFVVWKILQRIYDVFVKFFVIFLVVVFSFSLFFLCRYISAKPYHHFRFQVPRKCYWIVYQHCGYLCFHFFKATCQCWLWWQLQYVCQMQMSMSFSFAFMKIKLILVLLSTIWPTLIIHKIWLLCAKCRLSHDRCFAIIRQTHITIKRAHSVLLSLNDFSYTCLHFLLRECEW